MQKLADNLTKDLAALKFGDGVIYREWLASANPAKTTISAIKFSRPPQKSESFPATASGLGRLLDSIGFLYSRPGANFPGPSDELPPGVTKIEAYKTADGKVHESLESAARVSKIAEMKYELRNLANGKNILSGGGISISVAQDDVINDIMEYGQQIYAILDKVYGIKD